MDAQQPWEKCQRVLNTEYLGLSGLKENCLAYHSSPCGGQYNIPSCDCLARCDFGMTAVADNE
jgi:hypothetical protein